jgi:DNA-binding GntR family transcriptional regulator
MSTHEPIRTVGSMVYQLIREAILEGAYKPGERLRQEELADAIGVSRVPVRSALMQLDAEGLIRFSPHRGAVVNGVTADEMRELYEMRALVEPYALRSAMESLTPERVDELEDLARALNQADDGEEFLARRLDFYRALYNAEGQPQTMAVIEHLQLRAGRYSRTLDYIRRPGHRDHMEILPYLRAGDVEGATSWLVAHLEAVGSQVIGLLEREEPEAA